MHRTCQDWAKLAKAWAKAAYDHRFEEECGAMHDAFFGCCVIFVKSPEGSRPSDRENEIGQIRGCLGERGMTELASAAYPASGRRRGHVFAMLIDVGLGEVEWLQAVQKEAASKSRRMPSLGLNNARGARSPEISPTLSRKAK